MLHVKVPDSITFLTSWIVFIQKVGQWILVLRPDRSRMTSLLTEFFLGLKTEVPGRVEMFHYFSLMEVPKKLFQLGCWWLIKKCENRRSQPTPNQTFLLLPWMSIHPLPVSEQRPQSPADHLVSKIFSLSDRIRDEEESLKSFLSNFLLSYFSLWK